MADPILGALFDKDGTLFDFGATWNAWAKMMLMQLAEGDEVRATELGKLIGFDLVAGAFDAGSAVVAGTPDDIVRLLVPGVPDRDPMDLLHEINRTAARAPQVEAVPLRPLMAELQRMGVRVGVATNDAEEPARAHLASVDMEDRFDFIAGYDSGYGGKPEPGMCLGFAAEMGLDPWNVVMVGDSTHDLEAGHAAGMRTVGVLTGMAGEDQLAPLATAVLPDIGHLPEWIRGQC